MSLIKRYVYAVGRKLPKKSHRDIEKELESLIMDALEARVAPGEQYTEDDIVAVLKEFGPPNEAADRYAPVPQCLIGPKLFPLYRLVASIAAGAVMLSLTIALLVGLLGKDPSGTHLVTQVFTFFGRVFSGILAAIGSVTIVFAILERVLPEEDLTDADIRSLDFGKERWDPKKLPPASGLREWGSMGKSAVTIVFTVLVMAFFNLSPNIGIYSSSGGVWSFIPVIAPEALAAYLPLWNIVWVLTLVHHSILLVKREWSLSSRVLDLVVGMANVVVLVVMSTAVSLIDVQAILSQLDVEVVAGLAKLANIVDWNLRIGFIIAATIVAAETAVKAYRLAMSERQSSI